MRGSVLKRCKVCSRKGKAYCNANGGCKNPVYYIAYRVNGRQKRETVGTNKKLAEKLLARRLAQVVMGEFSEVVDIKFGAFADKWLDEYARPRVKQRTYNNYENIINCHLRPAFKGGTVSKINAGDIRSFLADIAKTRSPKTVNNILVLMKTLFKHAKEWGHTKINPAADIKKFKEEHREMDYLNPSEINLLLNNADEPYRTLFMTAVMTGMRRSEVLALQWGDIDWNSNTIHVRRSLYSTKSTLKGGGWQFVAPKSARSKRAIVMSANLKKALEIHKIVSPINEHDLVFANKEGNPISGDNMLKREFHPALERAGLRKIRFHDLRHSYTSLLIAQGENAKFIQSQLGHSSIQTTMDRYGHLLPVDNVAVGDKLDSLLFQNGLDGDVLNSELSIVREPRSAA